MKVFVTGGAGFIGSHTCKALAREGHEPITYDNLTLGHRENVKWGPLIQGDVLDRDEIHAAMAATRPDAIIHFAASAYVGESVTNPSKYYWNNLVGTLSLLEAARKTGVSKIIFSSTCAVYGVPKHLPVDESSAAIPINPYGRSKRASEHAMQDYASAYGMRFVALRYFNAAGADPDGELYEDHEPEPHLIPLALMAVSGATDALEIFGSDYPTPDGTCIRDYVHVSDLATGHVKALRYLESGGESTHVNLGGGKGHSILEVLAAIKSITHQNVPVRWASRRAGDPPILYANIDRARQQLDFRPKYSDLDTIVRTAWPLIWAHGGKSHRQSLLAQNTKACE